MNVCLKVIYTIVFVLVLLPGQSFCAGKQEILQLALNRVNAAVRAGKSPVVIFDLDDTLFKVANRTREILLSYGREKAEDSYGFLMRIEALPISSMQYSLTDNLTLIGVTDPADVEAINAYWGDRFFTSNWLIHDGLIPGAVDYVNRMAAVGAKIAYLTGRDVGRMEAGTIARLKSDGFPLDSDQYRTFLKPNWETEDVIYKEDALRQIREMGQIVACFDNEPRNTNLFKEKLPGALIVVVGDVHSPKSGRRLPGVLKVSDLIME